MELQLRKALPRFRQRRGQVIQREAHRGSDPQRALRIERLLADGGFNRFQFLQPLRAAFVIGLAAFGQAQAAGGTVQQSCLQMAFQLRHPARYGAGGHVQPFGGGGETAGIDDGAEYAHGFQTVHDYPGK